MKSKREILLEGYLKEYLDMPVMGRDGSLILKNVRLNIEVEKRVFLETRRRNGL